MKNKKRKEVRSKLEKFARIEIITDGHHGHYGSAYCENCHKKIPEPYYKQKNCMKCGYTFKGIVDKTPRGGRDE